MRDQKFIGLLKATVHCHLRQHEQRNTSDKKWEQEQPFSSSMCIVTGGNVNTSLHNRWQVGTHKALYRTTVDRK